MSLKVKTGLMSLIIVLFLIATGVFNLEPPQPIGMCDPRTHELQTVNSNAVENHLNSGWTYPPCVVEAPTVPPTRRPPDVHPANPPIPTRRPPDVPPANPPGRPTTIPPIVPTTVPTQHPIGRPPTEIPTMIPTETPTVTPTPTPIFVPTVSPRLTSAPILTPTIQPSEPALSSIPFPIEVPVPVMTPTNMPTQLSPGALSGYTAPSASGTDTAQLILDFIERNPGVLAAVISIIVLIPLWVRAEVNRRMMVFKDQLEDNKQQRDLIDRQQKSLEKSDEMRSQERRESRTDFLNTLSKQASEFAKQSETQTHKFSTHIGQLAANQAATAAALEQNNVIAAGLLEQLRLMREDAAKRDELHRNVQKALDENGKTVKSGFKEVGKTIKELSISVNTLKSKWEENHRFNQEVREELQNVKRIVESVSMPNENNVTKT